MTSVKPFLPYQPYRFPPLTHTGVLTGSAATPLTGPNPPPRQWQEALNRGFEQGRHDGHGLGFEQGRLAGLEAGRADGLAQGRAEGRQATLVSLERLAGPLDAMLAGLEQLRSDYRATQRREIVDTVAKVARQVIRAELALQPVQLLALVEETLAALPPAGDSVDVFLNPEELKRITELDPQRAARWNLIADARLDAGECRIKAGDNEVDAGCRQRLDGCIKQLTEQLGEQRVEPPRDGGAP